MNDLIDRQAVLDALIFDVRAGRQNGKTLMVRYAEEVIKRIKELPPAQPHLSEAYSKAVFKWLMDYQIRAAELKGRYTPYEVLSWVINDWRKENE